MRRFALVLLMAIPAAGQTCTAVGTTLNAATCSRADVNACASALSTTTTQVNIPGCPSGTSWTTPVTFTVPSGNTNLAIVGAGSLTTTGGGDQTVIIDNDNTNASILVIATNTTATGIVRLAGMTFKSGTGPSTGSGLGVIGVNGSEQFRFDHSHIDTSSVSQIAGMRIEGCVKSGVADHNIVDTAPTFVNNGIQEYNQGTCNGDAVGVGDQVWAAATQFGSANAFYLENNVFNNGFANDCTKGGAYVMRFNTFNMTQNTGSVVQTHPTGGAGRWRGCRQSEAYLNTFNVTSFMNAGVFFSSGPGMIWGNTCPGINANGGEGCKQFIQLESVLIASQSTPFFGAYNQTATPNGWGYCGTQSGLSGNGSNWDGNTVALTGYACLDQPGRGKGDLLTGGFTSDGTGSNNVTNNATGCVSSQTCAYPRQALEPVYIWSTASQQWQPVPNNTSHFVGVNCYQGGLTCLLTANQDYYSGTLDNGNLITFTGATGIGVGVLTSRPLTCTSGVAYWATDQGSWNQSGSGGQGALYICTGNAWLSSPSYTPYTYPHPLVTGGGGTATPPSGLILISGTNTGIQSNWSIAGTSCATGLTANCVSSYTETLTPPQAQPTAIETISGSALTYSYSPGGDLVCGTWNVSLVANWLDYSGSPTASPPATGSINEPCPAFVAKPPTGMTLAVI